MEQATIFASYISESCIFALRGRKVLSLHIVQDKLACLCLILSRQMVRRVD